MNRTSDNKISEATGFSRKWLRKHRDNISGYDLSMGLEHNVKAVCTYVREVMSNRLSIYGLDPIHEKARLYAAKADKVELEVKIMAGDLSSQSEMIEQWESAVSIVNGNLSTIPDRLAPQLAHITDVDAIRGILESEIYHVLNELNAS